MRVTIAYSPDLSQVGKTVDVDDEEARRMIREGRAVAATTGSSGQARHGKQTDKAGPGAGS